MGLQSLKGIGLEAVLLSSFKSYLLGKVQHIEIRKGEILNYAVQEGTVLGPILFTMYLNKIFTIEIVRIIVF